jgi:hypothetical protein
VPQRQNSPEQRLLSQFLSQLHPLDCQQRPYFPDLLNQPDLLVVPEIRRLIAVYVYTSRRQMSWYSSLAALEDLFEVKVKRELLSPDTPARKLRLQKILA